MILINMATKLFILIPILLAGLLGCHNNHVKPIAKPKPKNLNEAISYLDNDWNAIEKNKFKNLSERDALTSSYFAAGLWIRNNWVYADRDSALVQSFHKLGIYAPDDISSIILTSFHRELNNKPMDLINQIEPYKLYWKSIEDCEAKTKAAELFNYKKYAVGSEITISMYVDTSENQRNATVIECPNPDWKFNANKDLLINGVVTQKYFINSSSNLFFKVRIDSLNYPNTAILSESVKIGDIKDFSLAHLVIK